eukprot:scaffold249035_cov57-Attheya_sp.AAC.1
MDGRKGTLNDCIAALEREKTMESFHVNGSDRTKSHFIRLDSIDFRHRGESNATPKNVVLMKNDSIGDKVAVFHSGSGTGKSVELAGSSFVRSTDFTLLVELKDSVDFEKIDKGSSYVSDRNLKAWDQLKTQFKSYYLQDSKILSAFRRICNADRDGAHLRIGIGLDEASECPCLVRSIISDRNKAATTVAQTIADVCEIQADEIEVFFSVAGTGASGGTAGSLSENFASLKTSANANSGIVYELQL